MWRRFPSGATSESSPSSGVSATNITRKGAPFHGATGEASIANPASSWQSAAGLAGPAATLGDKETIETRAISSVAIAAAAAWRAGRNRAPLDTLGRSSKYPETGPAKTANCMRCARENRA
jgi:hypothetical protein